MPTGQDKPQHRTIATQTSRSATPLLPLLPITEVPEQKQYHTQPPPPTLKLPHALHLGRSVTDLVNAENVENLYSARFTDFFASARAIKREKRRLKLYGSLPNLSMSVKNAIQGIVVPVANIKEHAKFDRGPRRYHSIADLNNMRNKFTLNRYPTNDELILKRKDGLEKEALLEKRGLKSPITARSQAPDPTRPLSVVGRSSQTPINGIHSDSMKTLNTSKNYQFQRAKTHMGGSSAKTQATSINTNDGLPVEKPSIYKLAVDDCQLTNTPRDTTAPLTHIPLLCDSDRMKTPELSKYVNGNLTPHDDPFAAPNDGVVTSGHGVPVIHGQNKANRHTPKMVLKYYGNEIAKKSGIMPTLLPDNSKHLRSIISNSTYSESSRSGRKVSFREKKRRKGNDIEKKLATTSIVMTADNILLTSDIRKPLSLTAKNLALFDELQDKKPSGSSRKKDSDTAETDTTQRVAEWVKSRNTSPTAIPQIIPIKQTKSGTNTVPCGRITEVEEREDKLAPPHEVKVSMASEGQGQGH